MPGHTGSADAPPPIPLSTRPSLAQIEAAVSRPAKTNDCLLCRDFALPDGVAAQHPSHSLPRHDAVGYLARVLCDPFPSHTDKARAIFTWCHHNVAYDCESFFGGNIQYKSADDTIFSGKAVCAGYAETYKSIADRAGLECVVVTGHGKGFGHRALKKGQPLPKQEDNHAWNAVRIDQGEWKILDACWGAGNVGEQTHQFTKEFKPDQFTLSNEALGLRHYPNDRRYFFRKDGRAPTWEEYVIGPNEPGVEPPTLFTNFHEEGYDEQTVAPTRLEIPVYSNGVVRFQFARMCEHWNTEKHGKGKQVLLLLSVGGLDGRKKELIPMETDGFWWWVDANSRDLGAPGETVSVIAMSTMGNQDARGATKEEYFAKKGKVGMSWNGVIKWNLV
jgi:hypothetical protein